MDKYFRTFNLIDLHDRLKKVVESIRRLTEGSPSPRLAVVRGPLWGGGERFLLVLPRHFRKSFVRKSKCFVL